MTHKTSSSSWLSSSRRRAAPPSSRSWRPTTRSTRQRGTPQWCLGWCNPTESCSWSLCTTWSLEIGADLFETGEGGGDEHARQEIIFLARVVGVRSVGAGLICSCTRPIFAFLTYRNTPDPHVSDILALAKNRTLDHSAQPNPTQPNSSPTSPSMALHHLRHAPLALRLARLPHLAPSPPPPPAARRRLLLLLAPSQHPAPPWRLLSRPRALATAAAEADDAGAGGNGDGDGFFSEESTSWESLGVSDRLASALHGAGLARPSLVQVRCMLRARRNA